MQKFNSCVAVITGAGSGIGRALTLQLARHGARLAISDINGPQLESTAEQARTLEAEVKANVLDVADQTAFFQYADEVIKHFGTAHLVINNAGVAMSSGPLWQTDVDDFKWLMNINFYGVLYGTKAFLPHLMRAEWGHIVNISSLFGLVSVPEQNAYNASKFAVRGLTEALRQELDVDNCNVSCTSVHPGGIKTNIAANAKITPNSNLQSEPDRAAAINDFEKLAKVTPKQAAEHILRAVVKNKKRLLIGTDAKVIDKVQRLFPSSYGGVLQRLMAFVRR